MASISTSPNGSGQFDREEQGPRLAEKLGFPELVDLSDELDSRLIEERNDALMEIGFVHLVDLGGNLERKTEPVRNLDRAIGSLFREMRPRNAR